MASATLLAKAVSIGQPALCSSGSVIDLSAPDAVLAVASALPAKPVFILQPVSRSSGSVIDLSAPDAALALASALPAKPVFGLSSGIVIDIAGIDAVKENRVLADNHAFAIVVGQLKSQEQEAAYRCRALEESLDRERSNNCRQRFVIHNLETRLANNNANLISSLQEHITFLEESAEEASWSEWGHSEEIRGLGEDISEMRNSINWEISFSDKVQQENRNLSDEVYILQAQINDLRASCPGMESKMKHPPSEESTFCAACVGETAGVDIYLSNDNLSLFSSSDNDGSD